MEQELLDRARAGDRVAFAELVREHREAAYRAAYWVLKDPEEAMDATQDALLRAYRHVGKFAGRSSFKTWLRRIATNAALDRYARRQRDQERSRGLAEGEEAPDRRAHSASETASKAEQIRLVRSAIETLPPAQRAAVMLRDVEGLSYAEIGERLGVAKGTVMSRIYYGRQNLKTQLEGVLGPQAERLRQARGEERS